MKMTLSMPKILMRQKLGEDLILRKNIKSISKDLIIMGNTSLLNKN